MDSSSVKIDKDKINMWMKNHIVEKLKENLEETYENVTWDVSLPENCFFLSHVVFIDVNFEGRKNLKGDKAKNKSIQLVMKRPGSWMMSRTVLATASLFHNEILFYKCVSRNNQDFPRCFYYSEDKKNFDNTVIVMENIGTKGYELCSEKYDIPFEYVISGMETIGKFHAMSYVMKKNKPEIFFKIVKNIEETRFFPGDDFHKFIDLVATRPVEWLRKQNYDKIFVDLMDDYLTNTFNNIIVDAMNPVEPLAILCHGDFTRNNIFYKKTNEKLESMLIDFAMMRYGSPSIDLSTFLYLSCSSKDRRQRFNEIFKAYHNSLIKNIRKGGISDLEEFSYDKVLKDYKRKAMFGFITVVFFSPVQRGCVTLSPEEFSKFDPVKSAQLTKNGGGDELSKELSEMLLELRDTGCLDHVINS